MHVKMRHALAHSIVDRNERSIGLHGVLHGPGKPLRCGKKWFDQLSRQIAERFIMLARNEQTMPRKERPVIQERERMRILIDDPRRMCPRNDRAEQAGHDYQFVIDPSGRKYVCARFVTGCVISAICFNCFMSSSTPRPGRSFAYSFPFLKSRQTGRCGSVRP